MSTIKSLEDFITNKIISNISMNHEYNYPSKDRQIVNIIANFYNLYLN